MSLRFILKLTLNQIQIILVSDQIPHTKIQSYSGQSPNTQTEYKAVGWGSNEIKLQSSTDKWK